MFKKTLKKIEFLDKAGYVIYQNKKIAIIRHYNDSGKHKYLKDIGNCFWMLIYGVISIIGFPFSLIITLFDFIPKIYIKDYK